MMGTFEIQSLCEKDTIDLGCQIAKNAQPGDILCLLGDLGAGKTTFVKGVAKGLRIHPHKIHSPTFVLMNIYNGKIPLYHFDFYRLNGLDEIASIGYDEFIYGQGVSVIEWADRMKNLCPEENLNITLLHHGEHERIIKLSATGQRHMQLLEKITREKTP